MRSMRATAMTMAAAAVVLAGCGGDDASDAVEQLSDAIAEDTEEDKDAEPEEVDDGEEVDDAGDGDAGDAGDSVEVVQIDGRTIDTTVHHLGLDYTIEQMTVVDLDAEASADGEVDQRVQGIELTFEASAFNPTNDTANPRPPISLRWDEPDTGNVVDISGQAEFRQVPGDASSSGEIVVRVPPQDLELYDDASARLVLGQSGQSAAQVPIGAAAELIDRHPVQQASVVGESFDVNEVLVTITAAEVRWDYGNSHVEDGVALLELTYDMDNQGDGQSCSTRGQGAFALTLPNGDGIVDEGVTERCVSGGETETGVRTGFLIDGDYPGDYILRHERSDDQDEMTFALEAVAGAPAGERDTR